VAEDRERRGINELLRRLRENQALGQDNIEIGDLRSIENDILVGDLQGTHPVLHKTRKLIRLEDGTFEREIQNLKFTACCGHLLHSSDEVGGKCQFSSCEAIVCTDCIKSCSRCGKALCKRHQKIDGYEVYCPRCKEWVFAARILKRILGMRE
jgi:hypothetical protein